MVGGGRCVRPIKPYFAELVRRQPLLNEGLRQLEGLDCGDVDRLIRFIDPVADYFLISRRYGTAVADRHASVWATSAMAFTADRPQTLIPDSELLEETRRRSDAFWNSFGALIDTLSTTEGVNGELMASSFTAAERREAFSALSSSLMLTGNWTLVSEQLHVVDAAHEVLDEAVARLRERRGIDLQTYLPVRSVDLNGFVADSVRSSDLEGPTSERPAPQVEARDSLPPFP